MVVEWNRVDRRGQKPGHEVSSDEQLPLEVEDKFTVRARELLAPQWPEAPCQSARTDLARQEPTTYTPQHSNHLPMFAIFIFFEKKKSL